MTERRQPEKSATDQASGASQRADAPRAGDEHEAATGPEARRYGFPAAYNHEVCAIRLMARGDYESSEPGRVELVRWRKGSGALVREVPVTRLYVWARAGRISFGDKGGRTVDIVLLGEPETEGLRLGAPWPPDHGTSAASNVAHGVVTDMKNAVTFPVSFPRMMRVSGERNAVLDAVVAWCKREVPDVHIMRGWFRSSEGPYRDQVSGVLHKGLLGEPGWLPDTVGARPAGWSPFRNDRNVPTETARSNAHEHPSGA